MLKIFIILFIFLNTNNLFANDIQNSKNTFIISNKLVSYKSTNASEAKDKAIKRGQREALKELFKRAGININYTKFIDDNTISEMVETIKISDEIITKQSYSSNLTILFNKDFINFNLKKMGISQNSIKYEIYLYIPLFEDDNGKINVMSNNDWYDAAYNNFFENNYQNIFIIDNYSLSNAGLISNNMIKDLNYDIFKTLLLKYESNVIVISIAKYNKFDDTVEITFKEIDAENINEKILNFSNKENLTKNELIKEASIKTLEFLNNQSQTRMLEARNDQKNLNKIAKNNFIDIYFIIPNLKEYIYIKNLINNLDFIKKYETLTLTTKLANIRLYYKGDESEIAALFNNKGFILNNKNGIYYINYKGF